jgi:hypothetical protein
MTKPIDSGHVPAATGLSAYIVAGTFRVPWPTVAGTLHVPSPTASTNHRDLFCCHFVFRKKFSK